MKFIITILLLISSSSLFAQDRTALYNRALQLQIGRGTNGDGDIMGHSFTVTYKEYFHPHFFWNAGIGATLHHGEIYYLHYEPTILRVEGTWKYNTGGMQVTGGVGYSIIHTLHHELEIKLNTLVRYQVSSENNAINVDAPGGQNYRTVQIYNANPERSVRVGYLVQAGYNYSFNRKWYIGVAGNFQNDTEASLLAEYAFTVGRRF